MAVYIQLKQRRDAGSRVAQRAGDYNYIKDYCVVNSAGLIDNTFNGWIVQLVQKRSQATVSDGRQLRTTKEFLDFTSDQTTFMTHSYIERFRIENGISVEDGNVVGDQFASGGVTPYHGTDPDFATTPTSGSVNQVGTNILFSDASAEFLAGFNWTNIPNHPANGLEAINDMTDWPALVAHGNAAANKPIHSLEATWISAGNTQLRVHFIYNGPRGPPGGMPRDGVADVDRVAYCRGLEQEALMPGHVLHSVAQRRDGGFYANLCKMAACTVVALGLRAAFLYGTRGGRKHKQRTTTRRLRI
jgi:hypothetical protein